MTAHDDIEVQVGAVTPWVRDHQYAADLSVRTVARVSKSSPTANAAVASAVAFKARGAAATFREPTAT